MPVTTQVTWSEGTPSEAQAQSIQTFVRQLVAEGATDGVPVRTTVDQGYMITRTWTTVNDATTWITYIADFNPISAELIE